MQATCRYRARREPALGDPNPAYPKSIGYFDRDAGKDVPGHIELVEQTPLMDVYRLSVEAEPGQSVRLTMSDGCHVLFEAQQNGKLKKARAPWGPFGPIEFPASKGSG